MLDGMGSDRKDGGALKRSGFEGLQRLIGFRQGKTDGAGLDRNGSRLTEEVNPVLPGIGRDTSKDPLTEELTGVGQRRNRRHVDTGQRQRAAPFERA